MTVIREQSDPGVGPWEPSGAITRRCRTCQGGLQGADDPVGSQCSTCRWSFQHDLIPGRVH